VQAHVPWFRIKEYYSASPWRGTWALDGGGAYMNQAIHMIDLATWLMGRPEIQCCRTGTLGHDNIEVEDTAVALLKWGNRAFGLFAATTAAFPGFPKRLEIMGMEGTAIIEEDRITEWRFSEEGRKTRKFEPSTVSGAWRDRACLVLSPKKHRTADNIEIFWTPLRTRVA